MTKGVDPGRRYRPGWLHRMAKRIDGLPGEWTYPVFALRAMKYHVAVQGHTFYEPLRSYDTILRVLQLNARLLDAGQPTDLLMPVSVSMQVFPSIWDAPKGRVPFPAQEEHSVGAHYVSLFGYEHDGSLLFLNSWGREWGDDGLGWFSPEYVERYLVEAWTARTDSGPSPANGDLLRNANSTQGFRYAWNMPFQSTVEAVERRPDLRMHVFDLYSLDQECLVTVVELRKATGDYVAWAHSFHLGGRARITSLQELFVWPLYRQQGYGRLLIQLVELEARRRRSRVLQVPFYEADMATTGLDGAKAFLGKCGFTWMDARDIRPDRLGYGTRGL
jgi:GNAT superfamily N-acetyltransferase